ncbi:MAG: M48 family metalloprotease [Candidatus Thorarchaeota archaeon]|nr:M48 family metalloprotease [Candidatus Thorarchaeota archaeon]
MSNFELVKNGLSITSRRQRFFLSVVSIGAGAILIPLSYIWIIQPLEIGLIAPLFTFSILVLIQLSVIKANHTLEIETRAVDASFGEFLRFSFPNVIFYNLLFLSVSIVVVLIDNISENILLLGIGGNALIISLLALMINWPGGTLLPIQGFRELDPEKYPKIMSVLERSNLEIHLIGFLPLRKIKVINAYQWGSKKNAVIAISDYLEQILTEEEIAAVVAHELGHIKNHHFSKMIITLSISPLILINFYCLYSIFDIYQYLNEVQMLLLLAILGFLALGVPLTVIPWISRRREVQADEYAACLVGREIIASALRKLVDNEVVFWDVDKRIEFLLSHPSISKRVTTIEYSDSGEK